MAKQQRERQTATFEQQQEASGKIRLDRRLSPQEAAEQDRRHREAFIAERAARFAPRNAA